MNTELVRVLLEKAATLPSESGVYRMHDKDENIIYIGKAKNLKNRVSSYFRSVNRHSPKVYRMVESISDFDYIVTDSEFEALILECSLIKLHSPRYNILLKDDKGYHYIKVSNEPYPRITSELQREDDGAMYLGPYMSGLVVRETVDEVNQAFMLPTCKLKFPEDFRKHRPCLNYHIKRCMGVCTGRFSESYYNQLIAEAVDYIKGGAEPLIKSLTKRMEAESEALNFERAAYYRDRISAISKIGDSQKVIEFNHKSLDCIASVTAEDRVYFALLMFREHRLVDKQIFSFELVESVSIALTQFVAGYYTGRSDIPHEIFLDGEYEDIALLEQLLSQKAERKVKITVPKRGSGKELVQMAKNNAAQEVSRKTARTGREIVACDELGKVLSIPSPRYIEAYDISNFGSATIVGAMVVFEHGRPLKRAYKRFIIKQQQTTDDYSAMREMLTRRFKHLTDSHEPDRYFATTPDLILIDGGLGHLAVAQQVLGEYGLKIPVFGMVKDSKHRTRAIAADDTELAISTNRTVFSLVTAIQDEVHRSTIRFSRERHTSRSFESSLTSVQGIGKAKAQLLMESFRTIETMHSQSVESLKTAGRLSQSTAEQLYSFLHQED